MSAQLLKATLEDLETLDDDLEDQNRWAWMNSLVGGPKRLDRAAVRDLLAWGRIWNYVRPLQVPLYYEGPIIEAYPPSFPGSSIPAGPITPAAILAWAVVQEISRAGEPKPRAVYLNDLVLSREPQGLDWGRECLTALISHYEGVTIHCHIPKEIQRLTVYYLLLEVGFFPEPEDQFLPGLAFLTRRGLA